MNAPRSSTEPAPTLAPAPLRALLTDIIDYAGLFPPAKLPLDEAIQNYARYRQGPQAWMLARFVHPVRRLDELTAHAHLFREDPPFRFSVLGTGGEDANAFLEAFDEDLRAIHIFHTQHRDRVLADVVEVRLPARLLDSDANTAREFFDAVHQRIVTSGLHQLDLFYEVPLTEATRPHVPDLLDAMAEHNSRLALPLRAEAGLKMRCGGTEPDDVPAPEDVARAIAACRDKDVRFKATAGLHHPLRHYDDEVGTTMHGFFNVFGAAALAYAQDLDAGALRTILEDEDADHFRFDQDALTWQDHAAPLDEIRRARERLAISFGSCSFDEPRDDLRQMGLL